ncbi:hypothetical protein E2C01_034453 [Portunus trituberculatus]|uniref:Uncharacterized protein n=1 Tax=Portunus trituberculatus TaxID=210409 RepID=A0A5B7F6Q1_PORTR|nr:hypothetical protein [Portunus trituberculatus]
MASRGLFSQPSAPQKGKEQRALKLKASCHLGAVLMIHVMAGPGCATESGHPDLAGRWAAARSEGVMCLYLWWMLLGRLSSSATC